MSAISGVSSPTTHCITQANTQTKTTPTPNPPQSGITAPTRQDSDGGKDGSIGTKINTFA